MIPNIETEYERITNAIVESLPDGWQNATVTAIFYADSITWESEFRTTKGELRSFEVSMELTRAIRELRRKFKEAGQTLWGQASFVLSSEGNFNIIWGYEKCDENGDTIWDAEEWQRRQDEREIRLSPNRAQGHT